MDMSELVRINKFLSENGYCSRREADRLIRSGNVFINDRTAELGDKVAHGDDVRVHGRDKKKQVTLTYLLYNKPLGSADLEGVASDVYPVGDYTMQTEGLIFFTNDAVLGNRMLNPRFAFDKEYVVTVSQHLNVKDIKKLQNGLKLEDGMTLPAHVRKMDENRFAIILQEGRRNQIKRMCETLGYTVESILRTRLLTLKMPSTYPKNKWRHLTETEVEELKASVGIEKVKPSYKLHKKK